MTKHLVFAISLAACGGSVSAPPPAAPKVVTLAPAPPSESAGRPDGYVEMKASDVVVVGGGASRVILTAEGSDRVLTIYIGGTEAASIRYRLHHEPRERPLTHDLLDSVLQHLHATIVKVQVDELRSDDDVLGGGGVFIGSVYLRTGRTVFHVDARPSDAIALALGNDVPIYVAQKVLDEAGTPKDQLPQYTPLPTPTP